MSLTVVTGPPASGKSTWVLERAKPGDIVIDYDRLANALTGHGADTHDHHPAVIAVARAARRAAITAALDQRDKVNVYIIHTHLHPRALSHYQRLGAQVVTLDPGRDVVLERCRRYRPHVLLGVASRWYDQHGPRDSPLPTSRDW